MKLSTSFKTEGFTLDYMGEKERGIMNLDGITVQMDLEMSFEEMTAAMTGHKDVIFAIMDFIKEMKDGCKPVTEKTSYSLEEDIERSVKNFLELFDSRDCIKGNIYFQDGTKFFETELYDENCNKLKQKLNKYGYEVKVLCMSIDYRTKGIRVEIEKNNTTEGDVK